MSIIIIDIIRNVSTCQLARPLDGRYALLPIRCQTPSPSGPIAGLIYQYHCQLVPFRLLTTAACTPSFHLPASTSVRLIYRYHCQLVPFRLLTTATCTPSSHLPANTSVRLPVFPQFCSSPTHASQQLLMYPHAHPSTGCICLLPNRTCTCPQLKTHSPVFQQAL